MVHNTNTRKSDISKKKETQKREHSEVLTNCMWLSGRGPIVERLSEERRVQWKQRKKKRKTRQRKNETPEKGNMTSASEKTCPGDKFAPLVANQLWRANQHEHACIGLSSSWSSPSRLDMLVHAVVQS